MLVEIEKIKVSDRIRKDFGNITELAEDIKENGLINPPVVTPEYELIAGERRLRAMQALSYKQIEVRVMSVKDAEHQLNLEISENETRKDFSKAERIDYAKRLRVIEELKARERQGERNDLVENFPQCSEEGKTRDIVATKLGVGSGRQLEKEEYIVANATSLSPADFSDWDEGKLSTNKAFLKIKAEKEQLEQEASSLQRANASLGAQIKNQQQEIKSAVSQATTELNEQIMVLQTQKQQLERKVRLNQEDSDKYAKLQYDIEFLTQKKNDLGRQIESATELAGMTVRIQSVLEKELAPIKYKRCMEVLDNSEVAVENLTTIVELVHKWLDEMYQYLPNDNLRNASFVEVN